MKRKLKKLLLIAVILFFAYCNAKSDEIVTKSDLSLFAGVNYFIAQEELYRVDYDNDLFETGVPLGLNLGGIYKINDGFNLRSELIYNSKILYYNESSDSEKMILSKLMMNLLFCYNHKLDEIEIFAGLGPTLYLILGNSHLIQTTSTGMVMGKFSASYLEFDMGFTMIAGLNFPISDWTKINCGLNYNINNLNETLLNEPTKNWYGNVGGINIFSNFVYYFE
jgi:hypothetical protein